MLLFKNGLRKLLKDYIQFFIYLLLITIAVVFTSTFAIVSSNLISTNNEINRNYEKFDYSFRYTSSGYKANDTQTFTPWFAFNTELITNNDKDYFPTLTFGDKGSENTVLLKYEFKEGSLSSYDSSVFESKGKKYFNFHFGDVESNTLSISQNILPTKEQSILQATDDKKIEIVRKGEFGDFYRFNFNSKYFKNSLIGKLYEKNNMFTDQVLSNDQKQSALNIFDYMFYLNNSSLTYSIKQDLMDIYENSQSNQKNDVENFINESSNNEDFGRIGKFSEESRYYFSNHIYELKELDDKEKNLYENYASFNIKKHDSRTIFKTSIDSSGYIISENPLTQRSWFDTYFSLLGDLTNFKLRTTNEAVMWNQNGNKFRYISSFYNYKEPDEQNYKVKFYNQDLYTIYSQFDSDNLFTENSFMVSNGYAKFNNLELGKEYELFPNSTKTYRMDGIGVDSLNVYPSIYEEDLLTNQEKEAIFYISNTLFSKMFNGELSDEQYQDVSRAYLIYKNQNKENMTADKDLFSTYLADNVFKLKDVAATINSKNTDKSLTNTNIQSYEDTSLLNFRSSLYPSIVQGFYIVAIIFCLVFSASLCFVIYNIFRKILISQRSQIGNLKSLGISNFKIISNYVLYMLIPVFILVPIGWTISLFLQTPLMTIFEKYFNIPTIFNIDWQILLLEGLGFIFIVSFMVVITTYFTVRQKPLQLLSPSKSMKPNLWLTKMFSKIKYINFTSKLRGIIISSSIKDLAIFFAVLFGASLVISLSSLVPSVLTNMSQEYFKNIQYNNDYNYINTLSNNPLTRYSFYDINDKKDESNMQASIFNVNVNNSGEYKNLISENDLEFWKSKSDIFRSSFENVIINNLLTFKGGLISSGIMDQLLSYAQKVDSESEKLVETDFNNFTCQVMPTLFGQEAIELDNSSKQYNECIKSISNNILPSTVKQLWNNDENEFKNFTFNFSKVSVNSSEDELYTRVEAKVENNKKTDIVGYGIDLENNSNNLVLSNKDSIKYDSNLDYIPVLINKKMQLEGFNVGDEFDLNLKNQKLAYVNSENKLEIVNEDQWKYIDSENPNENVDLYSLDLSKMAYSVDGDKDKDFYYYDYETKGYKKYYKLQNVTLDIDQSKFKKDLLDKVNKEYQEYSKLTEQNQLIRPFDIFKYENGKPVKFDFQSLIDGTNNWINIALNNGLLTNTLVNSKTQKKLKVVGVEELYDGNKIYLDQLYANEFLGYNKATNTRQTLSNGKSVNIWSNAKMSKNEQISDQMQKLILNPVNSNNASISFDQYFNSAIGFTDYVKVKKDAISDLITSVVSIAVIFISISMITSIIVIYLITDLFIGRYKNFMSYMRIQGYTMREINSIILWVFLPSALLAVSLGIITIWLVIKFLIPSVLLNINIAVPLIINGAIFAAVFFAGILIFTIAYALIINSVKRVRLASLIGNE